MNSSQSEVLDKMDIEFRVWSVVPRKFILLIKIVLVRSTQNTAVESFSVLQRTLSFSLPMNQVGLKMSEMTI